MDESDLKNDRSWVWGERRSITSDHRHRGNYLFHTSGWDTVQHRHFIDDLATRHTISQEGGHCPAHFMGDLLVRIDTINMAVLQHVLRDLFGGVGEDIFLVPE